MTIPYPFQREDVRRIHRFGVRTLVASDMGTGKSAIALWTILRHPEIRPVIVICPAVVKYHWQREALIHIGMQAEVLEGTRPPSSKPLKIPELVIINYDILWPWMKFLKSLKPKLVILDESQKIASLRARRTLGCKELILPQKGHKVPHVLALSGTPLVNRPSELWPTLHLLWPKHFKNVYSFYHKHCNPKRMPWGWSFNGATKLDVLHEKLTKLGMIRRRKEDVLDQLPKNQKIVVPIGIEDRKQYDKAASKFLQWLMDRHGEEQAYRVSKTERLVWKGYLLRLIAELKLKSVLEWVDNWLENSDGKLILFGVHKELMLHKIKERYADISVLITGEVSPRKRQVAIDKFRESKKTRLFIGNILAGGVGWNGTCAQDTAFVEFGWTPGALAQASDRANRIGQTQQTQTWFLVAENTWEVELLKLLRKKSRDISAIIDGSKCYNDFDVFENFCKGILESRQ